MELVQGVEESVDASGRFPTELIAHRDASCVLLTHKKFEELRSKHAPKCGIVRLFCANLENMTRVSTVEWLKRVSFFQSAGVRPRAGGLARGRGAFPRPLRRGA
jgi:hypothetical protein